MINCRHLIVIVVLGLGIGILSGCGRNGCHDADAVSTLIRKLTIKPEADFVNVYGAVAHICTEIEKTEDTAKKNLQYMLLATRLSDIDLATLSSEDRVMIFSEYWHSIALVCAKMMESNSLDVKAFSVVLNGWKKCRQMCDFPDNNKGSLIDTLQLRGNARKLKDMFENDAALFERDILRLMFKRGNLSPEHQSALYNMWHAEFGCRVKEHHSKSFGISSADDCPF